MTWLERARFFSAAIAVVAALAWITGSNHCVLGVINQPRVSVASMSHCPGHPNGSDGTHDSASGMLACCQGLLSPNFEVAKAKIPFPVLVAIQLFALDSLTLPEEPISVFPSGMYETGPPSLRFFVGTVLRRSLPENAPPLLS